eukprot:153019-Prymnesium_polylepis.1
MRVRRTPANSATPDDAMRQRRTAPETAARRGSANGVSEGPTPRGVCRKAVARSHPRGTQAGWRAPTPWGPPSPGADLRD